ncbi:MAG: hypothetical protein DCC71_06125 [Proteobacteria bacterium]|nr:MAG: hypothetical protein DCC71_06125 [Pseudomonadota bacterium]
MLEAAKAAGVPYAGSLIALERGQFETIERTVAALHRVAHGEAWQRAVDDELRAGAPADAAAVALHRPANFAVFMGYDFHLTPAGPRLIEVNTNAGGALLNGLHTASLCDPVRLTCLCSHLMPVETMQARIVETFRAEQRAARGDAPLGFVAIADDRPGEQFLRGEFELFVRLFAQAGVDARICDVRELERVAGGLALGGRRVDLVYLRDTDWRLEDARSRALRDAYLADEVVVTPSPREHHLLANKRRLLRFSSPEALAAAGAGADERALLAAVVPETHALADLGAERAWSTRREWVFKPAAAYASRAVYRGDKISRKKLDEIAAQGDFVVQRRVEPGEIAVATSEGPRAMKFDVRAYAYRDEVLLLGARVYQGQVTNLRTPGGGFSAICVVRDLPACA